MNSITLNLTDDQLIEIQHNARGTIHEYIIDCAMVGGKPRSKNCMCNWNICQCEVSFEEKKQWKCGVCHKDERLCNCVRDISPKIM